MQLRRETRFAAPPDRVAAVLCSEELHLTLERAREGVAETAFVVVAAPGGPAAAGRTVFELRGREYRRTLTGGIDRRETVASVTRNEYDAAVGTLRWSYQSGNSERIAISGTYRLLPDGDGTRLVHDVTVDVRMPLVGGRVAKYIAGEMEKSLSVQDRLMEKLLTRPAG